MAWVMEDNETAVDALAGAMDDIVEAMPPEAKSFLGGEWLGHPLHPLLTDLPIGFWTSSWFLDIFGGRRSRRLSTFLVGLGVASAAPTIAAGLVEFSKLEDKQKRETGVIHMVANGVATLLYTWSFFARLRGRRGKGIALGMLGATAATVGGYLGGQLAFGKAESELGEGLAGKDPSARPDGAVGVDDSELHVVAV
jgi:uncharacterized membrane protein